MKKLILFTMLCSALALHAQNQRCFVLRSDDVTAHGMTPGDEVSKGWKMTFDWCEKNNVKLFAGVLADSLEDDNPAYFELLKKLNASGNVEFFLHGFRQRRGTPGSNWEAGPSSKRHPEAYPTGEAREGEERCTYLYKYSQRLARENLGFEFESFAHHNGGCDRNTGVALTAAGVKYWLPNGNMYGRAVDGFKGKVWSHNVDNEPFIDRMREGKMTFEDFKKHYDEKVNKEDLLVLLGHGWSWNTPEFYTELEKVVNFLRSEGYKSVTFKEYWEKYAPEKLPVTPQRSRNTQDTSTQND